MYSINFINAAKPKKYYAIRFWILVTFTSILGVLIILSIFQIIQWQTKHSLMQEKKMLEKKLIALSEYQAKINALKVEKDNLTTQLTSVLTYTTQPRNPVPLLKYIKNTQNITSIDILSIKENSLEIKIVTKDTTSLLQASHELSQQSICNGLGICAIEHKDSNNICALLKVEST